MSNIVDRSRDRFKHSRSANPKTRARRATLLRTRMTRKRFSLLILLILVVAASVAAMGLVETPGLLDWLRGTELTIHWTVEGDDDVVGFHLYRADSASSEFEQINDALITATSVRAANSEYRFVDKNVIRGQTYYYKLSIVYASGQEVRKGPYAITAD